MPPPRKAMADPSRNSRSVGLGSTRRRGFSIMMQVIEPKLYHTPKNAGITFMDPAYDEPFVHAG
jgi:hypothetical protein